MTKYIVLFLFTSFTSIAQVVTKELQTIHMDSIILTNGDMYKINISTIKPNKTGNNNVCVTFKNELKNGKIQIDSYDINMELDIDLYPWHRDYNNDGIDDYSIQTHLYNGGANRVRAIFIYNKTKKRFVYIKNSNQFPVIHYNSYLKCLDSWGFTNDGMRQIFFKLESDSLQPTYTIDRIGDERILGKYINHQWKKIKTDTVPENEGHHRYKNYEPYEKYSNDKRLLEIKNTCINERKRAQKDIKKGELTYFYYMGGHEWWRSNKEMKSLLQNYNISIDSTLISSFDPKESFCYEKEMQKEINKNYGEKFIDSLRTKAEIKYINKHPDKIFYFGECDMTPRYPGVSTYNAQFEKYTTDFFKNFSYPIDYKFKNERYYSYTSANFVILKDGSITDLTIKTSFQNPKNNLYTNQFNKNIKNFIEKTHWVPAKKSGIKVNSNMSFTIHYK